MAVVQPREAHVCARRRREGGIRRTIAMGTDEERRKEAVEIVVISEDRVNKQASESPDLHTYKTGQARIVVWIDETPCELAISRKRSLACLRVQVSKEGSEVSLGYARRTFVCRSSS